MAYPKPPASVLRLSARLSTLVMLCASPLSEPLADEQEDVHPLLEAGFSMDLGVYFPDRTLDLRVNGTLQPFNDEIDFDESVKLRNDDETNAAEMAWRFRGNWSLLAQFYRTANNNSVVLGEDVEWEDWLFGAGSNAQIGHKFSLTRVFVGRELESSRRHSFGVGAGLHWLEISTFIEGTAIVNGTPQSVRGAVRANAPLPNIGVWYRYSITPKWALRSRFDLLSADVGKYDGLMINASLGVNYQMFEHVGIGAAWSYFELDIGVDQTDWRGNVETKYEGVYVYLALFF